MSEKTTNRLKEAADLLAMVEEIMGSDLSGRSAVNSGMRITIRNAREAVIRSCIEVHRDSTENMISPTTATVMEPAIQHVPQSASHEVLRHAPLTPELTVETADNSKTTSEPLGLSDRLLNRKRDLRASIERMVDRSES